MPAITLDFRNWWGGPCIWRHPAANRVVSRAGHRDRALLIPPGGLSFSRPPGEAGSLCHRARGPPHSAKSEAAPRLCPAARSIVNRR